MPSKVLVIIYNRGIVSVCHRNECLKGFVSNSVHTTFTALLLLYTFNFSIILYCLYVRFLRRGSGADRLLGVRVRMPPVVMAFCLLWMLCAVRYSSLRQD